MTCFEATYLPPTHFLARIKKFANSVEEMLYAADSLISEVEAWTPPD